MDVRHKIQYIDAEDVERDSKSLEVLIYGRIICPDTFKYYSVLTQRMWDS